MGGGREWRRSSCSSSSPPAASSCCSTSSTSAVARSSSGQTAASECGGARGLVGEGRVSSNGLASRLPLPPKPLRPAPADRCRSRMPPSLRSRRLSPGLPTVAPLATRHLLPAAGLPSPKKIREKRLKRREAEEKSRGRLTF
uniref:Uncharacterized protein n=1 Tax=Oryza sativa subsp. japonica TaxID=39947 RepID=Q84MF8_ORYSJ|nr:hypothetical protein Os03g31080 [Oryza sativa Japonica Group]